MPDVAIINDLKRGPNAARVRDAPWGPREPALALSDARAVFI